MTGIASHGRSWITRVKLSPTGQKLITRLNTFMISNLGVRVTSATALGPEKRWFDRLLSFQRLLDMVQDVDGDVVECGVAWGESLSMLASLVRSGTMSRHIYGFDSWGGLPSPSKEDLASTNSVAVEGRFAGKIGLVLSTLRRYGFDDADISERITLVKGLFSDTLPHYPGRPIALLHIDVDIYQSYKECLQYLWPKVSVGGVVLFDEYHLDDIWPGAKKAVDEFFQALAPGSARLEQDPLVAKYYAVKLA